MHLTITDWRSDQTKLQQLRQEVFILEQGVSAAEEWDGFDETAIHFLLLDNHQQALGCARLLLEHDDTQQALFHIGRVAIRKAYRQQGWGQVLMRGVVAHCQQLNPQANIYLHAQLERLHFYQQLGFVTKGEKFIDAGIAHICMYLK